MPSYQVTFTSERLMTVKNYVAYNMTSAISAVIDSDDTKEVGKIIKIEVRKVNE